MDSARGSANFCNGGDMTAPLEGPIGSTIPEEFDPTREVDYTPNFGSIFSGSSNASLNHAQSSANKQTSRNSQLSTSSSTSTYIPPPPVCQPPIYHVPSAIHNLQHQQQQQQQMQPHQHQPQQQQQHHHHNQQQQQQQQQRQLSYPTRPIQTTSIADHQSRSNQVRIGLTVPVGYRPVTYVRLAQNQQQNQQQNQLHQQQSYYQLQQLPQTLQQHLQQPIQQPMQQQHHNSVQSDSPLMSSLLISYPQCSPPLQGSSFQAQPSMNMGATTSFPPYVNSTPAHQNHTGIHSPHSLALSPQPIHSPLNTQQPVQTNIGQQQVLSNPPLSMTHLHQIQQQQLQAQAPQRPPTQRLRNYSRAPRPRAPQNLPQPRFPAPSQGSVAPTQPRMPQQTAPQRPSSGQTNQTRPVVPHSTQLQTANQNSNQVPPSSARQNQVQPQPTTSTPVQPQVQDPGQQLVAQASSASTAADSGGTSVIQTAPRAETLNKACQVEIKPTMVSRFMNTSVELVDAECQYDLADCGGLVEPAKTFQERSTSPMHPNMRIGFKSTPKRKKVLESSPEPSDGSSDAEIDIIE